MFHKLFNIQRVNGNSFKGPDIPHWRAWIILNSSSEIIYTPVETVLFELSHTPAFAEGNIMVKWREWEIWDTHIEVSWNGSTPKLDCL